MKQVKVKLPSAKAKAFATFLATHGIVTLLSWSEADGFWDMNICAEVAMKDEIVAVFQASEWNQYAQKS